MSYYAINDSIILGGGGCTKLISLPSWKGRFVMDEGNLNTREVLHPTFSLLGKTGKLLELFLLDMYQNCPKSSLHKKIG